MLLNAHVADVLFHQADFIYTCGGCLDKRMQRTLILITQRTFTILQVADVIYVHVADLQYFTGGGCYFMYMWRTTDFHPRGRYNIRTDNKKRPPVVNVRVVF